MLETPHVALGAAIAVKVGNPLLAIPLSLASHFVLDKVPHWNPHLYTETQKFGKPSNVSTAVAAFDIGLSLVGGIYVASRFLPDYSKAALVLACCFASVLPDVVKYPYYYFKVRLRPLVAWVNFERNIQVNTSFWPGTIAQFLTVAAAIWWIRI